MEWLFQGRSCCRRRGYVYNFSVMLAGGEQQIYKGTLMLLR